jgi:hypothetical protein
VELADKSTGNYKGTVHADCFETLGRVAGQPVSDVTGGIESQWRGHSQRPVLSDCPNSFGIGHIPGNPARHRRSGTAHRRSLLGPRLVPVLVRAAAVGMRRSLRVPTRVRRA